MAAVAASGKAAERAALAEVTEILGATVDAPGPSGLFARIVESWAGEPDDVRRVGVAHDVALIHIASMSNLAAALGWALVDLAEHPDELARVLAGDTDLGERVRARDDEARPALDHGPARCCRRSSFDTGDATYDVPRGDVHRDAAPAAQHDGGRRASRTGGPDRWARWRLAEPTGLASPQLVTAFGHGRHTCPAQPFSLSAMTTAVTHLFGAFEMTPDLDGVPDAGAGPDRRRGQGGAVPPRSPTTTPNLDFAPCPSAAVVVDGLVMRYGDTIAVDGLSLTVEAHTITAVLGPNGAGKTTTLETCEGYRAPQAGLGPGARARPAPATAATLLPRIGVMLQEGGAWSGCRRRRDAAAHRRAARAPARPGDARGAARPRRVRADAVPTPLRRPQAAPRAGDGAGRAAGGRVRRRADRGPRPGGAARRLGDPGGAPRATARPSC